MKFDICPSRDLLSSHLLGKVRGPNAESIDEHLVSCESCLMAARELNSDDEFTEAMRAKKLQRVGSPSEIAAVIQRGKRLNTETETTHSGETVAREISPAQEQGRHTEIETTRSVETVGHGSKKQPAETPHEHRDADTSEQELIDFLHPAERHDEIGRLGGYRVLELMGVGGMGVVFRAEDPTLERLVALKAMKPAVAASKSAKDRFLREAKATAALEHDNIVPIYQVGEDRSIPFIAMQLLHGESLQTKLEREQKLGQLETVRIGREIAAGLSAAHQRDLIHRDIKPDNIWIEEETGRAKILDFGLVLSVRDDVGLTRSGVVLGTPRYMAPEQAQGQRVDHRGDLFSLGSVLYQLVSGIPPFEGGSLTSTLTAVAYEEPKPIRQVCQNLDADLEMLISRLLNKDVAQRPQSAADVAEALAKIEKKLETEQPDFKHAETIPTGLSTSQSKFAEPAWIAGGMATLTFGIFLALWAAGFIFKVESEHGTILVQFEGNTQGIKVGVGKDKTLTITDPNDGKQIKVAVDAANKQLRLEKEGFRTVMASFSLKSPEGHRVKVSFEPKPQVAAVVKAPKPPAPAVVPADAKHPLPVGADVRQIAEHVISLGGGVNREDGKLVWNPKDLPDGPLSIRSISFRGGARVTDQDIPLLTGLPELDCISFGRNSLTDAGYASLAKVETLKQINFVKVALGNQGLAELVRLPHLEMLEIFHTDVTDEGLQVLSQMPSLKYLTLGVSSKKKFGDAYLSDAGLAHLAAIEGLERLWLMGPTFTDAGIDHLGKLKFLRVLAVWTPNISDAGLKRLRELLPVCAITDKRGETTAEADEDDE